MEFSLDVLKNAADSQPKNALYQGAYHFFKDGDQTKAYAELLDETLFPKEALPTNLQYVPIICIKGIKIRRIGCLAALGPEGSKGRV